jgi:DNA helicase-2/ATP-dependent DNA helicase PcrA
MTTMITQEDLDTAFGATRHTSSDILEGLNPAQKEAVESIEGPVRIMAGAGTGKTTVIIRRIANIIQKNKARPEEVLAVTFTRKAAGEMRSRLGSVLGDDVARRLTVGNFHAISSEMLRRYAHLIDLPSRFTVLDEDGQKDVITDLALQLGYLDSRKDKIMVMRYLNQIASWKEDGYDSDQILAVKDLTKVSLGLNQTDEDFLIKAAKVFEAYQIELSTRRWCDFADLVLHMVRLFRKFPEVHAQEAGRFRFIMVDEFQDTSPVQNEWVRWMARDHRNICVVGDTDQSIYEWRNARPEIMLRFPETWEGAKTITIDTNYRSTQEILDIANTVVEPLRAKDGLEKKLRSDRTGAAPRDFLRAYDSGYEEADEIASTIASRIDAGTTPSEIAVLCRSGMIITGIERGLRERGIRYVVAGAMKFTDREEIKDAIAWLTLAANPMDYVAFGRIASKPTRGLGPQKVTSLRRLMMDRDMALADAAAQLAADAKKGSANARIYGELKDLAETITQIAETRENAGMMLEDILDETGYREWRESNKNDPQCDQRLENLDMIVEEASGHDLPIDFLEMLSLQAGGDKGWGDDSVVVSTVHASKGLEFDEVFCPAMEQGVFPNARSEKTPFGQDEERRLAHVAWTRARTDLHISFAAARMGNQSTGEPSPYLLEAGLLGYGTSRAPRAPSVHPGRRRRLKPKSF